MIMCSGLSSGAIMDLGGWLRSLGLEQYEAAFRENEINDAVLPSLTAEDLKDLGVVIVGHRRTLLNAIAALRAEADAKAGGPRAACRRAKGYGFHRLGAASRSPRIRGG
jgi:hypothetical protein